MGDQEIEKVTRVNIAYPQYGTQKLIEVDDEQQLRIFFDKRISEEVPADKLGEAFKGYVFKITGGFDKQGFPMKQGIMKAGRLRVLLDGESGYFHHPKRRGSRRRKNVRGCIVANDISTINVVITKKGDNPIEGLTDPASYRPRRLGPKRANKIRKTFRLSEDDDVRKFVVRRPIKKTKGEKTVTVYKAPKIQRLITPDRLHRKRRRQILKERRVEKAKTDAQEYAKLLAQIRHDKRTSQHSKKKELLKRNLKLKPNLPKLKQRKVK